jgi:hypothetical protein
MYIQQDDIDNNKAIRITFASRMGKKIAVVIIEIK